MQFCSEQYNAVCDLISGDDTWDMKVRAAAKNRNLEKHLSAVTIYNLTNAISDIQNPNSVNHDIAKAYYTLVVG